MAATKHYFVMVANGTSVHRKGPFENADAAKAFVKEHYASWPCWLIPAEYIGMVPHQPLDKDGERTLPAGD